MSRREFHIKNMVSRSCIKLIEVYFDRIDAVKIVKVFLGLVILEYDKTLITSAEIEAHFETIGFRVAVNPDVILVE